MDTTTQVLTILIIMIGLAISLIASATARRRARRRQRRGLATLPIALRTIPAYDSIPLVIGGAIEADRPVHGSLGSAGIGGSTTIVAAAGAEAIYDLARRATTGTIPPIVTMSDATALALGIGALRRAYRERDRLARWNAQKGRGLARWYPQGDRSLAFAAAVTAMMSDERTSGSILIGSFGAELALILEAVSRRRTIAVVGSDQLEGQAVAYALADRALLGEELFAAPAYIDPALGGEGRAVAIDTLRWVLILALIAAVALIVREPLLAALAGMGG